MSMLRFILRKINVIHNSLIKFWSVRKSNESASLTQSIAKTKAKLQLNEAGAFSNRFVCFFLLWLLLWPVASAIFSFVSGWSVVGSLAPSVLISLVFTVSIKICLWGYRRQIIVFANINFSNNGGRGEVEFSCERAVYRSSAVASEIKNLQDNTILLTGVNSNTAIVDKICQTIPKVYNIYHPATQRNNDIIVRFDNEEYSCLVI